MIFLAKLFFSRHCLKMNFRQVVNDNIVAKHERVCISRKNEKRQSSNVLKKFLSTMLKIL